VNVEDAVKAHIEADLLSDRKVDLTPDTNLSGIVDSSGVLELAMWIENTFDFSVELDQISAADFATIRSLSDWIRRNVARAGG
jgi:acyl carrier protein